MSRRFIKSLVFITLMLSANFALAQEQVFDGIDFVRISASEFTFGSPESQANRTYVERPYTIEMDHNFWIGKYEVTQAQWEAVMGYNPSQHVGLGPVANQPVETISWTEVQNFIDQLNANAGGEFYRLPTEAEWEFVAKADTTTAWSFGDNVSLLSDFTYTDNNPLPRTIGGRQANSYGVYDLYGNLYEWCEDWYVTHRDPEAGACPPEEGTYKVLRGGSNGADPKFTRSTSRNMALPSRKSWKIGFRLVRVDNADEDRFRSGERCKRGVLGTDFYIQSFSGECATFGHEALTGDDRGGIATGYGHFYYTGDSNTLKSTQTLGNPTSVTQRDGLISDFATDEVYHFAFNGSLVSGQTGGEANQLIRLDVNLNPTNDIITLSRSLPMQGGSGVYSGFGEGILFYDGNYHVMNFIDGDVETIAGPEPIASTCENWAHWGIAERIDGIRYITFANNPQLIRQDLETGQTTRFDFNNLSDMCSITASVREQKWLYHHEGSSQFNSPQNENVGSCNADIRVVVDPALCGNGNLNLGERCDDGNDINTDDCLATCIDASCGDGYLHAGVEICDNGAENSQQANAACRTDCTPQRCGDGVRDAGEECDDGNDNDDDACSNQCESQAADTCKAYYDAGVRASGFYFLTSGVRVYCDMQSHGGGWTLVATMGDPRLLPQIDRYQVGAWGPNENANRLHQNYRELVGTDIRIGSQIGIGANLGHLFQINDCHGGDAACWYSRYIGQNDGDMFGAWITRGGSFNHVPGGCTSDQCPARDGDRDHSQANRIAIFGGDCHSSCSTDGDDVRNGLVFRDYGTANNPSRLGNNAYWGNRTADILNNSLGTNFGCCHYGQTSTGWRDIWIR